MGGAESALGEPERWINVCFSPAVAACVWLIKGRYTGLQNVPINSPSSGRHTGGLPHKDSPYGVSPATSKGFIRVPSPYTQLLNWWVFKQSLPTGLGVDKDFLSERFPEERGRDEKKAKRRGGQGELARQLGGPDLAERRDR